MSVLAITFGATLLSASLLTWGIKRYAEQRQLFDQPDERRLHDTPIPRGGGAAVLLTASAALLVLYALGYLSGPGVWLWFTVGIAFGALGWCDDHFDLPILPRLLAQLGFASIFVLGLALIAGCSAATIRSPVGLSLGLVTVFSIVWFVNLFNFMDGADGFAAGTSVAAAVAGALIAGLAGSTETVLAALVIAGSIAGFLVWNWHPARIFMGDVGSYFIGFQFCALAAHDVLAGRGPWVWLILFAPFVTDASLTLARRVLRRERFWDAHRSHVYQLAILAGHSHARVSAVTIMLTLTILAPLAYMATTRTGLALPLTAAAYALNGMLWFYARHRYATH